MAHTCNPNAEKVEIGGSIVQNQARLSYMRLPQERRKERGKGKRSEEEGKEEGEPFGSGKHMGAE